MFSRAATLQQRFAATLLVVCLFHQMGACPCGCIEHNYWLQALGLAEDHDHDRDSFDVYGTQSLSSSQHDCDGSHDLLYVDNSFAREFVDTLTIRSTFSARSFDAALPQPCNVRPQDRGPPARHHGHLHFGMPQVLLI